MKTIAKTFAAVTLLLLCCMFKVHSAAAFSVTSSTGGDGYTPIIRVMNSGDTRIFNIYHHQKPSGTGTPNFSINCVLQSTSTICPGYPKYFSSTAGSSNTGPDDISTSFYPHYATAGSKVYYAAQRASDNGIGCFDMELGTNCGYTALGSLAISTNNLRPAVTDGVEQVGTKAYVFGKDMRAYCYDMGTQAACVGQPYVISPSDATLPAYDGQDIRVPRQVIGTNIYLAVNYYSQSTPANARLTCFDTLTNTRCAGWAGGVSLPNTDTTHSGTTEGISSVFASYDTTGMANAVCTAGYGPYGASCWSLTSGVSAVTPTGLMSGLPASSAREETRLGNKTYFAFYQPSGGYAFCYDFTAQAQCAGFTNPHFWATVNGGNTRDYGYAYSDAGCFFATGDAGVLWSFDPLTGVSGDTSCPSKTVAAQNTVTTLTDTGLNVALTSMCSVVIIAAAYFISRQHQKYRLR
jgi:hypothetical protein